MHKKTLSRLAVLVLAVVCTPALAQDDADKPMPLSYDASAREAPVQVLRDTCPVHVVPTHDERQNKLTIGATVLGPLLTADAGSWVTDGLLHLKDHGYAVQRAEGGPAPAGGLLVRTSITRAYTWQIGYKIFSMVAVKAQFTDSAGVTRDKYYRAHGDKTNMWGASSEYVTTLNYGLNNLLRVMADDLAALCKGRPVEPYTYAGPEPHVSRGVNRP